MSAQGRPKRESAPEREARRAFHYRAQGRPKRESAPEREARRVLR
jgi:hypothetical protein